MNDTRERQNDIIQHYESTNTRCSLGILGIALIILFFTKALCLGADSQRGATAVATVSNGAVASIVITDGGSGYPAPPAVTLVGGGGGGASAAAQDSNGAVSAILIENPGTGYTSAPTVAIDPPPQAVGPTSLRISLVPRLVISGPAYEVLCVQYTTALAGTNHWQTLTNIIMGTNSYVLIDADVPAGEKRFYRVLIQAPPGPDPARWAWVNPGTFTMGSPETEYDRSLNESPQTDVTLSQGFWMERFELTQGEYTAVTGTNTAFFLGDTNQPVEQVSWFDASNYCALLTMQERAAGRAPTGYEYRLPTEAEWEYATRAGTTNRFFFGDDHTYTLLLSYAWFSTNSAGSTHDVGGKLPNPWGIYDTSGNVWEWCADWHGPYPGGAVTDPTGPATGSSRVMRGGSFRFPGGDARSAGRNYNTPEFLSEGIGLRVVLGPALH